MSSKSVATATIETLDEHVDDLCFNLALILRRLLEIDPAAEAADEDEDFDHIMEEMRDV